jgi:hypothetical protein
MPDVISSYKTMQDTHNWSVAYKQAKRDLDGVFKSDDHWEVTRYFDHAVAQAGEKPLPQHIAKRLIKYLKDQKKEENKNKASASRQAPPIRHSQQEWLEKVVQDQLASMPPYRPRHQYFLEYAMRHMPGDRAVDIYRRVIEKADEHKNLDVKLSSPTLVHLADRLTVIKSKEEYFEAKASRDKRGEFTQPDEGEAWTDTIEHCLQDINGRLAQEGRNIEKSKSNLTNIKRDPAKNAMLSKKDKAVSAALHKVITLQNNIVKWNHKELIVENKVEFSLQDPVLIPEKPVATVNKAVPPKVVVQILFEPSSPSSESSDKPALFKKVVSYFKENLGERFAAAGGPVQDKKASEIKKLLSQAGEFIADLTAPTIGGAPDPEGQKEVQPFKEQALLQERLTSTTPQKRTGKIIRKL